MNTSTPSYVTHEERDERRRPALGRLNSIATRVADFVLDQGGIGCHIVSRTVRAGGLRAENRLQQTRTEGPESERGRRFTDSGRGQTSSFPPLPSPPKPMTPTRLESHVLSVFG